MQSIKYEQQAFTALILVYSLLDSMRELFVYMPARKFITAPDPKIATAVMCFRLQHCRTVAKILRIS